MLSELVDIQTVRLVFSLGGFDVVGFLDFLVFYGLDEKSVLFELKVFLKLDLIVIKTSRNFL